MSAAVPHPALLLGIVGALLACSPCRGDQKPKETESQKRKAAAVAVVEAYFSALREGQVRDGMRHCWDMRAVVEEVFGADAAKLGGGEVDEVTQCIIDFDAILFAGTDLAKLMPEIRSQRFEPDEERDGTVSVRCTLVGESDRFRYTTTYYVRRKGDTWRITAQFTDGKSRIGILRDGYLKARGKLTPVQFGRIIVAEAREEANREPAPSERPAPKP